MDGGRRLLRPVREAFEGFQPCATVYAGVANIAPVRVFAAGYGRRSLARRAPSLADRLLLVLTARGVGTIMALGLFLGVGLYGARLGGEYSTFVAAEGSVAD